jgi:hypothetical protein
MFASLGFDPVRPIPQHHLLPGLSCLQGTGGGIGQRAHLFGRSKRRHIPPFGESVPTVFAYRVALTSRYADLTFHAPFLFS